MLSRRMRIVTAAAWVALAVAVASMVVSGVVLGIAWWGHRRNSDALAACDRLLAEGTVQAAAARCRDALQRPDMRRAAARLADARYQGGETDAVLAWATVLGEDPAAGAVWRLVAQVHAARDDQEAERTAYQRALRIHRAAAQPKEALRDAFALYNSYWRSSAFRDALQYAEIALLQARRTGYAPAQHAVLLGIFSILYDIGDLDGAGAVLRLVQAQVSRADGEMWLDVRFDEGLMRYGRGELAAARSAYSDVLASAPRGHRLIRKTRLNLIEVELGLGEGEAALAHLEAVMALPEGQRPYPWALRYYGALVARARGDLDTAAQMLRAALADVAGGESSDWAWRLHHELGMVLEARGNRDTARAEYLLAIGEVEKLRTALGFDELKDWLLKEKRAPYEALFTLEAEHGDARDALAVAERVRARAFLDAAIQATRPSKAGELHEAAERIDVLRELIPSLRASPVVEPGPIGELLQAVRGSHIFMYTKAQERLWLATAGASSAASGVRLEPLAVSSREVEILARRLFERPDDREAAEALGAALLPEKWLAPAGSTIYVIADELLADVPFAALRVGGGYLMERHSIVHVPSLNALAMLGRQAEGAGGPAVVLGDARGDLPGAAEEALAVARARGVQARTGAAASTEALRGASRADLLHLGVHTGVSPRGAWIELADGRVDAGTVLSWGLGPRLAVLASCTSAASRGKGPWSSLAAAFLAAGSRTVLASLWSIHDQAARRLVLRFYDEGGVRDPAGALARAQRALAAQGEPPSVWAPFVLFGSAAPGH